MWVAKFRVSDEKNELSIILRKNKIRAHYYPINNYSKGDRHYFVAVGIIEGEKSRKEQFFKDLTQLKDNWNGRKIELLEVEGDFFTIITSHSRNIETNLFVSVAYNPSLIHFEPVLYTEDGWEEWKIASIERKEIEKMIKVAETKYKLELLSFSNKKINNFGFMTLLPTLSERQTEALSLAIKEGYYEYPRNKDVQDMAKMKKVSFSTFQEHLRRAENKIIPFVAKQMKHRRS